MKWFSLLTVGLMSLCALGSAQDRSFKSNSCSSKVPHTISLQYTPATDIPLSLGQSIRLDQVISLWKAGFAISSDGTMIRIKKAGNYNCSFGLLLSTNANVSNPSVINVEFSKTPKKPNWTVLAQYQVSPNTAFTATLPTFYVPSAGSLRLRVNSIGTADLYLAANQPDVTMTVAQAKGSARKP